MNVTIRGDGIAARSCGRLLEGQEFCVVLERPPRRKLPAIMIGATTQRLFRDTFGRDDLFVTLPAITRRLVAWGPGADALSLPHSAVIVNEQDLLDRLPPSVNRLPPTANRLPPAAGVADQAHQPAWTIVASRPLPESCTEQRFGSRTARAVAVQLREDADRSACWVESLENGWLFLIPGADASGWLLAVGDLGESVLEGSGLVSRQIAEIAGEHAEFPSSPRIVWPLCGPGWLACGTGALAFDPLCGDGSGHAIREAILAAAVLRSMQRGGDRDALLIHYRSRLLAGFQRHLETCEGFYRTGGSSPWWQAQLQSVRTGWEWCARELECGVAGRYQLRGFDLERV